MKKDKRFWAELISWTKRPIETIYCIWEKSKNPNSKVDLEEIGMLIKHSDDELTVKAFNEKKKILNVFLEIIKQNIPVAENVDFVFMVHNDPISHREQMVRHRIGVHYGDNYGVDMIPDLAKSTWWSQSMRILDMSKFYDKGNYFIPDTIKEHEFAIGVYNTAIHFLQSTYKKLLEFGIPMEDARNVLPLGATMDISWKLNLSALIHIIGKRSCWILQYGLWSYIIKSMIDELCEKINPIFRQLVLPPCFKDGEFNGCVYELENQRRLAGYDKLPICSLWSNHTLNSKALKQYFDKFPNMKMISNKLVDKYTALWGKDAKTGESV